MSEPVPPVAATGRVPFWGRLETRVIAALVLLGILCVGSSAYLVQLAVAYFDARVGESLAHAQVVAEKIEPFYHGHVEAQISAFEARGEAMALESSLAELADPPPDDGQRLQNVLEREEDVVALALQRTDGTGASRDRTEAFPESEFQWFDVTRDLRTPDGRTFGHLRVVFRIDPRIDARYQELGGLKRELGVEQDSRSEIEDAVERVVGAASILVLALSVLAGFALARATTRKASELSSVMARVAVGDLDARARRLGNDELGQLAQAFNRMLDELARAQDRVAYLQRIGAWQEMARRIAHEIKNPLTPISLAAEQLAEKDPKLSPQFTALLETSVEIIQDEIRGLRRMVTSFSQFAKVPQVRREPVAVARVLEEFERAYGHLTDDADEAANDVLDVRLPESTVVIDGDRQLLKQVLVNLVENAVLSAREAGQSPIEVHVHTRTEPGFVEILVDDNGPGISEERAERVFEPYETTRAEGTGLGLAIVKKVVLDHGGEVSAQRAELGGARFVLRIPTL